MVQRTTNNPKFAIEFFCVYSVSENGNLVPNLVYRVTFTRVNILLAIQQSKSVRYYNVVQLRNSKNDTDCNEQDNFQKHMQR